MSLLGAIVSGRPGTSHGSARTLRHAGALQTALGVHGAIEFRAEQLQQLLLEQRVSADWTTRQSIPRHIR